MKRILAYCGHLFAATLAVPWLTIMAAGLAFGIVRPFIASVNTPQRFYSQHVIFLAAITGMLLAYCTSGTFTSKSALWVWIPATMVFVFRVLDWRASGSALVGSGSLVEHFFTANCQFQNWRQTGFDEGCPDKLFLTPLFIGSLFYSAGAAIRRFIHSPHPPEDATPAAVGVRSAPRRIVATRVGAVLALAFTGSMLGSGFHEEIRAEHSSWKWLFSGLLPAWLVVTINIAFWAAIYFIGIGFARAQLRKDEKALLFSISGKIMLVPVAALFTRINGLIYFAQTMLSLTAFLAALAILLSLMNKRSDLLLPRDGWQHFG